MQDLIAYLLLTVAAGWLVWTFLIPRKLKLVILKSDKNNEPGSGCNCEH